jgi:hypothetical protein
MDFDPKELKEIDADFLKRARVSWITRMLLSVSLSWGMSRLVRELGMSGVEASRRAHSLFAKVDRVDVFPSRSGMRGFHVVLDGTLALFFCQDGDHFVYDGFEMGPYEAGDVTIFD